MLITGATGLLGNNIVRQLCEGPYEVRVLLRESSNRQTLADLPVEMECGALDDDTALQRAMEGVDAVIHSAGFVKLGKQELPAYEEVNVKAAERIARAAKQRQIRLVHVSSINALGVGLRDRPATESWNAGPVTACPYVRTKSTAEGIVRELVQDGLHACIVNPALMFGPWDWRPSSGAMILEVARKFTPIAPRGGISVCDVRDVAQGTIAAVEHGQPGENYILAGENMYYRDLWRLIARVSGGRPPIARGGPLMLKLAGLGGDLVGWATGKEPDVNSAAVKMGNQFHYFDSTKAIEQLGYRMRPVEQTLQDAWQWFQQHDM